MMFTFGFALGFLVGGISIFCALAILAFFNSDDETFFDRSK